MQQLRTLVFFITLGLVMLFNISFKATEAVKPKKVILMIGDGMGLAQISGGMAFFEGQNAFERFKVIGLSKTSSGDHYVTDSGAGATAFSIGKKAYNNGIGIAAVSSSHPTLFELAKKKGLSTGVAVTSSIVHATPASFYAHVKHRRNYELIAEYLLAGNCDIAIGGGSKFFNQRTDRRDLLKELAAKGFTTIADSSKWQETNASKLVYVSAFDGMPKMQQGRGDFLKKASAMAMRNLNANPNGYMLMIEGSQIDWGGHDMDFEYMKAELIDFNEVINLVLDAAAKDGNTLVIVTADHETGGLALTEDHNNHKRFVPKYTYNEHTGIMVPVFAFGPGAEQFGGMYENTEIFTKLKQLMGL